MLPLNANQIPVMFNRAIGLARAGKPREALDLLGQLSKMAPKRAEIPFHMAQIHLQAGRAKDACDLLARAANLAPAELKVWQAYATAVAAHGDAQTKHDAKALLKTSKLAHRDRKAVARTMDAVQTSTARVSANASTAEINALVARINAGRMAEAEAQARQLIATRGKSEILSTIHGAALASLGRLDEAEAAFRTALKIDPDYGEAAAQLGQLLRATGHKREAKEVLLHARRLIPQNPIVLGNLGTLYHDQGAPREALECLDLVLKQDPDNQLALLTRAQAHLTLENAAQAISDLDHLERLTPATGETLALGAVARKLAGDADGTGDRIDAALTKDPDNLRVITIAANLLQQDGQMDAADTILRDALARGVRSGAMYRMIAQGKKLAPDDPLIAEMEALWSRDDLPEDGRMDLGYGLLKVMEDAGDYEKAWKYLSRSNKIMARLHPYDRAKAQSDFDRLRAFLDGFDEARIGTVGYQENQTIFVTGMPRSGTTLVEQILASHSTITGGDELGILHPMAFQAVAHTDREGGTVADMTADQLEKLGRDYQAAIDIRVPQAKRITDKTISTYQIAPLAWLALPNAKIVALRRDPRDNLWSIFKNRFVTGLHLYSYTQADLVDTYRLYTEYLALWRQMAPDRIYEIEYEALVADPETEVRKLLDFCGLAWEDACLDFHKTDRSVKTLSLAQVRQPLYSSSIGKWRRYEGHLTEMLDGLKGLDGVPED
ncbi:tetratricopeptide repeat-containing sulfotransferase family protein [Aliiroseovarius sediminis]|uniref:tetratricopeptide repeat-containing sulfotransferase family protein n=1 Tax=Aliiroseovarius sediminis TaxID=2925839 RepID=UPI001F57CEEA|nr:tetratricopeptide repeat-containing sulfotransferase family protein [Aliiroseovarius sediminis]MCI2393655.1 sulfotransferase [Aliiroseovarius sediminis]